jgi:hypothetical protein
MSRPGGDPGKQGEKGLVISEDIKKLPSPPSDKENGEWQKKQPAAHEQTLSTAAGRRWLPRKK